MALWLRRLPRGVIVHSDRGSQYCSASYQSLLNRYGLSCSMSAKGNCYDNACAERFFHTLKVECRDLQSLRRCHERHRLHRRPCGDQADPRSPEAQSRNQRVQGVTRKPGATG
jgi:transposase InsO family protein